MSSHPDWFNRFALVAAGIFGAGGVGAAASASHSGDERAFGAVALIALTHAGAFLALGLSSANTELLRAGALVIAAGVCLFSLDLSARQLFDQALFPMSAAAGGSAIIAGWALVAISGVVGRRH